MIETYSEFKKKGWAMFIKEIFERFLSEQKSKLAQKTYRDYASVIELFEHQLDGYAWNNIDNGNKARGTWRKPSIPRQFIYLG